MKNSPKMHKQSGFTLVELAVVFLIIAVLAAFALPQYQEYVRQGRRAEAMSALLDGAQKLERYYSAHGRYVETAGGNNLAAVFVTQTPYYTIASGTDDNAATETTYRLEATPAAGGLMEDDKCGIFIITQSGAHQIEGAADGVTADQCWRR